MINTSENNKRIAKNTILLYIRMGMSMLVSLYTSRVILNALGVEDFGIYCVVGGVVAMMGFLNASMSGATSRFLLFGIGEGNLEKLRNTFSSALIIHFGIAALVFVFAETIGLWFLYNKLIIPEGRMFAAIFVYQISVLTTMLDITQVPYAASLMAHERFGIYAYIELLNVFLRLAIVYILLLVNWDKLMLYSILVFSLSILIIAIYRIYCIRKFKECHFKWIWKKNLLLPLLSFSGWNLYGNVCVTARHQGMIMLLNMFFGTAINAAAAIAFTVQATVSNLVSNIVSAFNPQIIKQYAAGNYQYMERLMLHCCRFMSILFLLVVIPLMFEMHFVMYTWLGVIPEGAVNFARIVLVSNWLGLVNGIFVMPIHATGKIKELSFITGNVYLFSLLVIYIILKLGGVPDSVLICLAASNGTILLVNMAILKKKMPNFPFLKFSTQAFIPIFSVLLLSLPFFFWMNRTMEEGWIRLLLSTLLSLTLISSLSYYIILDKQQRILFYDFIKSKLPNNQ